MRNPPASSHPFGLHRIHSHHTSAIKGNNELNISIESLSSDTNDHHLRVLFERYGRVGNAFVIRERHTGSSRGFGFVEMDCSPEARAAIQRLNGSTLHGRTISVKEALSRTGH